MQNVFKNARRFAGIKGNDISEYDEQLSRLVLFLQKEFPCKSTYRVFPLKRSSDSFEVQNTTLFLDGKTAKTMLSDCDSCVLLAATLGSELDAYLRKTNAKSTLDAFLADACASALIESACDELCLQIAKQVRPKYTTDRFSPGYGDFPLEKQKDFFCALNLQKTLGLTLSDSYIINPQKTVTAAIGLSDTPKPAKIRGCEYCCFKNTCNKNKEECHI